MAHEVKLLSTREIEILHLIAMEYTIKEIAKILFISDHTVISHRKHIQEKLETRNTAGMIRRGFELSYLRIKAQVAF